MKKENENLFKSVYGKDFNPETDTVDSKVLQATSASRTPRQGLKDGDIIEILDDAVVPVTINGRDVNTALAKINGIAQSYFLSQLVNTGYPVYIYRESLEDAKNDLAKGMPALAIPGVNNGHKGEVIDAWRNEPNLDVALKNIVGKKFKLKTIAWACTQYDTEGPRPVFEISWA